VHWHASDSGMGEASMHLLAEFVIIAQCIGILLIVGAFIPITSGAANKNSSLPMFGLTVYRPLLLGCGTLLVAIGWLYQGVTGLTRAM
jgi:hypothetical protein